MPGFVLHFGNEDLFAFERRRAANPIAFGQHTYNFTMCMLGNLPDERLTIFFRHPILWLNAHFGINLFLKRFFDFVYRHIAMTFLQIYKTIAAVVVRLCEA